MSIYGNAFKNEFVDEYVNIVFNETATVTIKKKNKEIDFYIRDGVEATQGASISKGKDPARMNHGPSVKIKYDNSLTPIETGSGSAIFDEKKYPKLKKLDSKSKKIISDFVNANIDDINSLWNNMDPTKDIDYWKNIIDRSYNDIKEIVGQDDAEKYLKEVKSNKKEKQ